MSVGIIAAIAGLGMAVFGSVLGRQLQSEFSDWTPKGVGRILESAVRRLPEEKQDRFREEWSAHIADTPGHVWKWAQAAGFLVAARRMAPKVVAEKKVGPKASQEAANAFRSLTYLALRDQVWEIMKIQAQVIENGMIPISYSTARMAIKIARKMISAKIDADRDE